MITVKKLSEKINQPHTKTRRCVKEILPPDPEASVESGGKARMITADEGFRVCLYAHLIAHLGFKRTEAKTILNDIEPWLMSKGLYPDEINNADLAVKNWKVQIRRASGKNRFSYFYNGTINEKINERLSKELGDTVFTVDYIEGPIIGKGKSSSVKWAADVKILEVSFLLNMYLLSIND